MTGQIIHQIVQDRELGAGKVRTSFFVTDSVWSSDKWRKGTPIVVAFGFRLNKEIIVYSRRRFAAVATEGDRLRWNDWNDRLTFWVTSAQKNHRDVVSGRAVHFIFDGISHSALGLQGGSSWLVDWRDTALAIICLNSLPFRDSFVHHFTKRSQLKNSLHLMSTSDQSLMLPLFTDSWSSHVSKQHIAQL
jgi:hypothetical protein